MGPVSVPSFKVYSLFKYRWRINKPSAAVMMTAGINPTSNKEPIRSVLSERIEALCHVLERLTV